MDPEFWHQVDELFQACVDLKPSDRKEFLDRSCPDQMIRREVESLLGQNESATTFSKVLGAAGGPMTRDRGHLLPGHNIGRYRILSFIGGGGMGDVYCARDTKLDRRVALKVLPEEFSMDRDRLIRSEREAKLLASLNHPHIAAIYDFEESEGTRCLVLELVEGQTLAERLKSGPVPPKQAIEIAEQIAEALEAAHGQSIIHRDLKPANVMITATGSVKVLDFGIAKMLQPDAQMASPTGVDTISVGVVLGTPTYMSPEQAQGRQVDVRSDIFSFGTLLYETLCGRRPFDGENKMSVLAAILRQEPAFPGEAGGVAIPDSVERIVLRCLRKDPNQRFQAAAELRAALQDIQREMESAGTSRAIPRRLRNLLPVMVTTTILVGLALTWFSRRNVQTGQQPGLTQITFEGGIAATPALSFDGKLYAFASDRAEAGNLDIWLRQMSGGPAVRLTSQPGVELNPQFSVDGAKLYYLNGDREIFEMPTLGGPARKLWDQAGPFVISKQGQLAFSRIAPGSRLGPIFIIGAGGGSPEAWQPSCRSYSRPAWSPDGSELFFLGDCGANLQGGIVAPRRGGKPVAVSRPPPRVPDYGATTAWFGRDLVFPTPAGVVRASLNGMVTPITSNPHHVFPTVDANGSILVSQFEDTNFIWSMRQSGDSFLPQQVVKAIGHFAVSHDGSTLVYGRLVGAESGELVVRDLRTGQEKVFAAHDLLTFAYGSIWPQISPDTKQIVYRVVGGQGGHYLLRTDTGEVKRIAGLEDFQLGSDWSPDSKTVLGECPTPGFGVCELDPASGVVRKLFVHPTDQLLYPSWSWDGRWLVFGRRKPGGPASIWLARIIADKVDSEDHWIQISPQGTDNSRPRFSLDGKMVYYIYGRSGMRQFAIQKIDANTGAAIGQPAFPLPAPLEITALTGGFGPYPLISVTTDAVYYSSVGVQGNLWLTHLH